MADSKITALGSIGTGTDPANDQLVIVDVSDVLPTGMATTGTTKRVGLNQLLSSSPTATGNFTITGDLTAARLIVTGGTIPTNGLWLATTNTLEFAANSLAQYRIAPLGVFSWFDGAGGTRMTLNSTGLGLGVSPSYNIDVLGATLPTIAVRATSAGASNARLYLECAGTNSGNVTYNRSLQALQLGANGATSAQVTLDSSGNVGVGVTPAGTGGCLQLKSGITFPATQVASSDANTLDDYEEGTWVPTVGGTSTYTAQSASYIKVGRLVTVSFDMKILLLGTGSTTTISGLPFVVGSSTSPKFEQCNGAAGYVESLAVNVYSITFNGSANTSTINSTSMNTLGGTANVNPAIYGNGTRVQGTVTYMAA